MIRVFVVDDHAVVREGVKRIIADAAGMTVEDEAGNAADALAKLRARPADVVVLDLTLPGRGGLDLLADIKREHPTLPVLILSVHEEEAYAVRALKAGASGYLTKDSAPARLVEAVEAVVAGERYLSDAVIARLATAFAGDAETGNESHALLSDREHEVLRLLASGLQVSEIANRLALSVKTVSTYRARILGKLGMKNNAQLVRYAIANHLVD